MFPDGLSEDEYDSLVETLHLLANPVNARRLRTSIGNAEAGRLSEHELPETSGR